MLDWILEKTPGATDCGNYTITNKTVFGAPNPNRNQLALVMFVTRTSKDAVRTLQSLLPDTADPLTVAAWVVTSTDDGLIEKLLFSVNIWVSGGPYVIGDIVYDVAGAAFFKCSVGNSSATRPGLNLAQWGGAAITADSLYTTEIDNECTTMQRVFQYDLNTCRIEVKVNQEYQRVADGFIRANSKRQLEYSEGDELDSLLQSAYSALDNDRPYEAEEIVRNITNFVLNYGSLS